MAERRRTNHRVSRFNYWLRIHASVQINVGHLDESGVYNGHFSTFALCGFTRAQEMLTVELTACGRKKKLNLSIDDMITSCCVLLTDLCVSSTFP
uniref:40S ribosomal protein S21 n=1 Tax=Pisum sativum TaxID=3888 RepID=O65878_PEA|nr:ribosomal protein S21 [Pisum sativum]